jgi:hypothetical protein
LQVIPARKTNGIALLLSFALAKLLIHVLTNAFGGYGIFRDELYYFACSNHLDAGYVDQPPLSIYILAFNRFLLGDSVFVMRLLPAIAGAATVYLTGRTAAEFGGGTFSKIFACLASIVSLINLGMDSIYSMNAFDHLLAALAIFYTARLLTTGDPKYWIFIGLSLGFGALNKIGMAWIGGGIALGILVSSGRAWFSTRWPWFAAGLALLIFLPYIIWNFTHDFAHLEFIRNASQGKYSGLSLWTFTSGQFLLQNPVTFPLWISGLYFFFFDPLGKPFRPLGIMFLFSFGVLAINGHSKAEYLAPAFPVLFAGGGVMFERVSSRKFMGWLRPVYILIMAAGLALAPFVLPVLPVETYLRYAGTMGVKPSSAETKELAELPQFYADMFGWEDKAAAVSRAYHRLAPEDQAKCAVFGDNYGRCGAIDFYGKKYGLPESVGGHNNYWIWGPRQYTGEVVLILGGDLEKKQRVFSGVEVVDSVSTRYCMPYENHLRIYLCRNLKIPMNELWQRIKNYN